MAFVSLMFVYLVIIIIVVGFFTLLAAVFIVLSVILKKNQIANKKKAEKEGNYGYVISKKYMIPRVIGIICLIPLALCIGCILWAFVAGTIESNTMLGQNVMEGNFEQVEAILQRGITPDCSVESNEKAVNGEATLLYSLADCETLDDYNYNNNQEQEKEDTLKMMKLLIQYGAEVDYTTYFHEKSDEKHIFLEESDYYNVSDKCGWTPLMAAVYQGDLDKVKLLVESGADVNAADYCGYNAVAILADNLNDEEGLDILNYLIDHGADVNAVTNYYQTADFLASRHDSDKNEKIQKRLDEVMGEPVIDYEN